MWDTFKNEPQVLQIRGFCTLLCAGAVMPRLAPGVVASVGYLVGDIQRPETIFARDIFVPSCA